MKINDDVQRVLEAIEVDDLERAVRIEGQLERKLYLDTNKVLEALGGKWNRKARAHLFEREPSALIEGVLETGEVETARDRGFFPTPPELAHQLAYTCEIRETSLVLEPSAGIGALVNAALDRGARVLGCERDEDMRARLTSRALYDDAGARRRSAPSFLRVLPHDDFMRVTQAALLDAQSSWAHPWTTPDRVLMNPPFGRHGIGDHIEHVLHAFSLMAPAGVLVSVLPISVRFRDDSKHKAFRAWIDARRGELEDLPEGSFKSSGTMVRTCTLRVRK